MQDPTQKIRFTRDGRSGLWLVCLLLAAMGISACDGDDGRDGADGAAGVPGTRIADTAQALTVTIESVSIASAPVVEFSAVNERGLPYTGLTGVRFTIAKLVPGSDGDPSYWQSYINRTENAEGNVAIQATSSRSGEFADHGDGRYTYRFDVDISQISEPLAVVYEPQLTHRVALQATGSDGQVVNAAYTWRPADGATTGIETRDIVATASCNSCHNPLAIHGGGRRDTQLCVTCHNPGSTDANTGNTVDFKVMVHKIHRGAELPSVQAGGEYVIFGFRNSRHDYSEVEFPQDIRNCTKCHDDSNAATPQSGNWEARPSMEACGSCHDNVNFALGAEGGHPGGVQLDNSQCGVCHAPGASVAVAPAHEIPAQLAAQRFQFNLLDISQTGPGERPVVRFSVTDPGNNDAPYDLASDPAFTTGGGVSRLALDIAWDTRDYTNAGNAAAQPLGIDALTAMSLGDGSYSATSPAPIAADATGSGMVALEGHPAADYDGDGVFSDRVPVRGAVAFFPITDATARPRREVVDIAKCNQCHQSLSLHGNNRTDEPQLCVACHNADATDIRRRPASGTADGLVEREIDFKVMIHAIHASHERETPYVVYGFGGRSHDFSHVAFPGNAGDCESCHSGNSFTLPLAEGVLATTISTGADLADPSDDINISPQAAVCSSCHDGDLAVAHMEQNGADFATSQAAIDGGSIQETCALCHGPERVADVAKVHPLTSNNAR